MNAQTRAYYPEPLGGVKVPVILVNDRDMHNVTKIWKGIGSNPRKRPDQFLQMEGLRFAQELIRQTGIPIDQLTYNDGEGWWFTQLLAIEYTGWVSPFFRVQVSRLAVHAAQELARQADPLWRDVREQGKAAHATASAVRDQFYPVLVGGKDKKHAFANAAVCKSLTGQTPSERKRSKGLGKNAATYDYESTETNALRTLILAREPRILGQLMARTRDGQQMVDTVGRHADAVVRAVASIDSPSPQRRLGHGA